MAKLAQLCPELCKLAQGTKGHYRHAAARRLSAYGMCLQDMERLGTSGLFATCKGVRNAKKAKNSVSREQAGTIGNTTITKRFAGSRLTCVCKTKRI